MAAAGRATRLRRMSPDNVSRGARGNALPWRLQYPRVMEQAGKVGGVQRLV